MLSTTLIIKSLSSSSLKPGTVVSQIISHPYVKPNICVALRDNVELLVETARQQSQHIQLSNLQAGTSSTTSAIRTFSAVASVEDSTTTSSSINNKQNFTKHNHGVTSESYHHHHHHRNGHLSEGQQPTCEQLNAHFIRCAIPMIGFGFMDQTLMLQAGNAIDCTIGVTFGMSTLSSAAFGQIISNAGSIVFGGGLEQIITSKLKLIRNPNFTLEQSQMSIVQKRGMLGNLFGVIVGCTLGLINLLFMDIHRTKTLKLQHALNEHTLPYHIEISNDKRQDATTIRIRGEDHKGLIASITTALSNEGLSLLEVIAHTNKKSSKNLPIIEDIFVVQKVTDNDNDNENDGLLNTDEEQQQQQLLQVDESQLPKLAEIVLQAAAATERQQQQSRTSTASDHSHSIMATTPFIQKTGSKNVSLVQYYNATAATTNGRPYSIIKQASA